MTTTVKQFVIENISGEELVQLIKSSVKEEIDGLKTSIVPEKLLSRKEAAEFLNISLPTLHSFSLSGKLKAYRLGKNVLFKKTELLSSLKPFLLK